MIIHVAESGKSFELGDFQPSTTISQIQEVLASLTGVPIPDQLLFAADSRLDPNKSLASHRDHPVFLFNRQRLVPNSPPPSEQPLPNDVDPVLPDLPLVSDLSSHNPIESAWDAAVGALPSYEAQFRYHFQKGNALLTATRNKLDACNRLVREVGVQELALRTVRSSTEMHYRSIDREYHQFMSDYVKLSRHHEDVLANFQIDFERLHACKLHPALRSHTRFNLSDLVKESSLKRNYEDCGVYHQQLGDKVAGLEADYRDLKSRVQEFLGLSLEIDLRDVVEALKNQSRIPEEQSVILESLKGDLLKVKKIMEDYSKGRRVNAQDVSLGLGAIHDAQINSHLPRMEESDYKMKRLLKAMVEKKNEMNLCMHQRMQETASLQASMKAVRNQMTGFREVMAHQSGSFEGLKTVRKIGSSYKACLAEVVRRGEYTKLYFGQAGQLAERMARKRDRELERREEFLRHNALPQELLVEMGLLDSPSQCVVDIAPFDSHLMDVSLSDLEKFSPRYLSGVMSLEVEPEEESDLGSEILGTHRLEVENAKLKAQLASSIAIITSMDSSFRAHTLGDLDDQQVKRESLSAAERTGEALRLKDDYAKQLKGIIDQKQAQCDSYESRIRELEQRLKEQAEQSSRFDSVEDTAPSDEKPGASEAEKALEEQAEVKNCIPAPRGEAQMIRSYVMRVPSTEDLLRECQLNAADLERKLHEAREEARTRQLNEANLERKLHEALEEARTLQLNAADVERKLREEARTHLCAAERRAGEYNALRASTVRMRGCMERLKIAPVNGTDSLRALAASVKCDAGDEVVMELLSFVMLLCEKMTSQQAELMKRCSAAEVCKTQLRKEVEDKTEMAKSLLAKIKSEKQASLKEKICLTSFEVHRLAIFIPNSAGHYEALNRDCPNYFLSEESIGLFRRRCGGRPSFVAGQIVHIERCVAREDVNSSMAMTMSIMNLEVRGNPFGLDANTVYNIVTLAIVPGLHCS